MIPIMQTIIGNRNGDCLRAAIASVLELDILKVPHFVGICHGCEKSCHEERCYKWHYALQDFIEEQGFKMVGWTKDLSVLDGHLDNYPFGEFFIIVYTPKDQEAHAIVSQGDRVIHDPNPSPGSMVGVRVSRIPEAEVLLILGREIIL